MLKQIIHVDDVKGVKDEEKEESDFDCPQRWIFLLY